ISVNGDIADRLDIIYHDVNQHIDIKLFDHHSTALWLNEYKWAKVDENVVLNPDTNNKIIEKTSATYMLYDYLFNFLYPKEFVENMYIAVEKFSNTVRKYDTWLWKDKYNDIDPKKWNDLLNIYGRDKFIDKICNMIWHIEFSF